MQLTGFMCTLTMIDQYIAERYQMAHQYPILQIHESKNTIISAHDTIFLLFKNIGCYQLHTLC